MKDGGSHGDLFGRPFFVKSSLEAHPASLFLCSQMLVMIYKINK